MPQMSVVHVKVCNLTRVYARMSYLNTGHLVKRVYSFRGLLSNADVGEDPIHALISIKSNLVL